jgi:glutamate-ammonia-ligase adenylyltransferase
MSRRNARILELASAIDPLRAETERATLSARGLDALPLALGVLACAAFPSLAQLVHADPSMVVEASRSLSRARDRAALERAWAARCPPFDDEEAFARELRRFARLEKLRVALREVLPRSAGGADVDVTAAELSDLADVTIQAALDEATAWARRRFGDPLDASGEPSSFVVLGMGKLGGRELNAGSDVDLIYFYDTDDGAARAKDGAESSLHEVWSRVARRMTKTLEEVTMDGFVWRVDLRLRPEGGSGPLVNSLAAAERYYEAFGRLWERAALLRARPVAGDLALGDRLLELLSPFVWRKRIDPTIAVEMESLVLRARTELAQSPERDLKLGPGGIREAEFFAQTLQLVWGGRDPMLRVRNTLEALARLEAKGLTTPRESAEVADAYLALRRAEHAVQVMTGVQTHSLPEGPDLERVARCLGFASTARFLADLDAHRARVTRRWKSVLPEEGAAASRFVACLSALERDDKEAFRAALGRASDLEPAPLEATADSLFDLARRPDGPLGLRTRESFPGLAESLLDAVLAAPDPAQAALYLRVFFARTKQPAVYVRLAFSDPAALRRLTAVLGASAFVGDALANNPELGDMILFSRDVPTPEAARAEVLASIAAPVGPDEDPDEALVGALRLAKTRITLQVALAFLGGEATVRQVTDVLSEVADASLEVATRRALGDDASPARGLAVLAMGKLGGQEISFGSDLDVVFFYDPDAAPADADAPAFFTRRARKVISIIGSFHGAGPGYEIDTRLRPSGNQGLLVTTLDAFARYHGFESPDAPAPVGGARAAMWERMALTRARAAAGDMALAERAQALAHRAAFSAGGDDPAAGEEIHRIRVRVERESSRERAFVHDLKLGKGGLLDIEFVVQMQQIRAAATLGPDRAPAVADTSLAIVALEALDLLSREQAEVLQSAYRFLRTLELKIRVVRADASHLLEENSPMLRALARRMDVRDRPDRSASDLLLQRYRETTRAVRAVYETVVLGRQTTEEPTSTPPPRPSR